VFPPATADFEQFLKAAHTVNLAQGEAFQAIKAASSKATVGGACGMAPAYPETEGDDESPDLLANLVLMLTRSDLAQVSAGPTRKTDVAEAGQKTKKIDSVEPAKYTKEREVWKNACCKAEPSSTNPRREIAACAFVS